MWILLLLAPGRAGAQTTDPAFLQWEWNPRPRGPRVSGLAGAFVTAAEGSTAVLLCPACLSSAPPREVSFSAGSLPQAGFVLGRGERWVFGARVGRSLEMDIPASGVKVTNQTVDSGEVSFSADSLALAVAWKHRWGHHESHGISLGANIEIAKLNVNGTYTLYVPATREESRVAYSGGKGQFRLRNTMTLGAIYERGHEFSARRYRLGLVMRGLPLAPDWEPERSSLRLVNGAIAESTAPARIGLREPKTVSVGGDVKLWSVLIVGQLDWTLYRDVEKALRENSLDGDAFGFGDTGVDWRAAAEYTLNDVGGGILKLRGGIRVEEPGRFQIEPVPPPGRIHAIPSFGASFEKDILGKRARVDADWFRGLSLDRFTLGTTLAF